MAFYIDITGRKFGKLTAIKRSDQKNTSGEVLWECSCDCGGFKLATSGNLRSGDAKSCGCLKKNNNSQFLGQIFGRLLIEALSEKPNKVHVICECGIRREVNFNDIKRGHTKSCGCLQKQGPTGVDLTGKRFGKLIVIKKSNRRNRFKDVLWKCQCDCGKSKLCTTGALQHGGNTSCGCRSGGRTHGDSGNRIRRIWLNMIKRCTNTEGPQYHNYGGRGIQVCSEWLDYHNFKNWALYSGYSDLLTLDRRDNNKGYFADNCRWATYKQQANNKRNNKILNLNGIEKTISEWAGVSGINQTRILRRINNGWSLQEAVFKPIEVNKISKKYR